MITYNGVLRELGVTPYGGQADDLAQAKVVTEYRKMVAFERIAEALLAPMEANLATMRDDLAQSRKRIAELERQVASTIHTLTEANYTTEILLRQRSELAALGDAARADLAQARERIAALEAELAGMRPMTTPNTESKLDA